MVQRGYLLLVAVIIGSLSAGVLTAQDTETDKATIKCCKELQSQLESLSVQLIKLNNARVKRDSLLADLIDEAEDIRDATKETKKAVSELKAGKIEFKVDKNSVINNLVGKLSFSADKILENIHTVLQAINRAKPSSAKGSYIRSFCLSSTMGPGLKIDANSVI